MNIIRRPSVLQQHSICFVSSGRSAQMVRLASYPCQMGGARSHLIFCPLWTTSTQQFDSFLWLIRCMFKNQYLPNVSFSGAACDINHHHLQNQTAQLGDCKNICSLQQSFVSAPSAIDHHSEFQVGWMIIQKGETPPSSTDWRGLAIWGVKFQSFNSNFQNVVEQHETRSPQTSSTIFVFNLYQSKRIWRKHPHFFFLLFIDALKTDCYQSLHLSLFSKRRVSSEMHISIGFRCSITTNLYLAASTTRKSETVLKETFWSQCWRRVWYSHVGLKKGVVFTCGSEKASFNRFGAIACKAWWPMFHRRIVWFALRWWFCQTDE